VEGKYFITVQNGQVQVSLDEYVSSQDVQQMLNFKAEEVELLLKTHSGTQAYWEALSIRLNARYENFKEVWSEKWWAHSNLYSRQVLAAYGDTKPTAAAIKEMSIKIYSRDASQAERLKYCRLAYDIASKKSSSGTFEEFYAEMYMYILPPTTEPPTPPWYFENVVETVLRLKEDSELVKSIAAKLTDKSFSLSSYAKAFMQRFGNTGDLNVTSDAERMRAAGAQKQG
jgi:hypothetical protein